MSRYNDIISNLGTATIFCDNLGFGEQGAILKNMPKSIFICPDNESCIKMQNQLNALKRKCVVLNDFNKPFTFSKFESSEHKIDLINAIYSLIKKDAIVISTPDILLSFIPNLTTFENAILSIDKNIEYDIIDLEKSLISIGYKKVETLTKPGEFVRRGDILDIFNLTQKNPIRLDFFDTQIEEMFFFDSLSFDKLEKVNSIDIVPNKLNIFSDAEKENILTNLNKLKLEDDLIFELISSLENDEDIPLEFISSFVNLSSFAELNIPIIISNQMQVINSYTKFVESLQIKFNNLFTSKKLQNLLKNSKILTKIEDFFVNSACKLL